MVFTPKWTVSVSVNLLIVLSFPEWFFTPNMLDYVSVFVSMQISASRVF